MQLSYFHKHLFESESFVDIPNQRVSDYYSLVVVNLSILFFKQSLFFGRFILCQHKSSCWWIFEFKTSA